MEQLQQQKRSRTLSKAKAAVVPKKAAHRSGANLFSRIKRLSQPKVMEMPVTNAETSALTVPRFAPPIRRVRNIAAVLFGIVIPVFILGQAFLGLYALQENVLSQLSQSPSGLLIESQRLANPNGNDYALFAMTYAEASNRQVV